MQDSGSDEELRVRTMRECLLDVLVHVNALLPCLVVYWTLAVIENAYAAVFLYESVCLIGVPLLTLRLRSRQGFRATAARLRPLVQSLLKPQNLTRCGLATTGSSCLVAFGGFATYLATCQYEFEALGISDEIREHSGETGLGIHSAPQAAALVALGVWFCTVNPVLEELFWRGYCYTEIGRMCSTYAGEQQQQPKRDRSLLQAMDQGAFSRWLVSLYFASFHAVVVAIFVSWPAAIAAFLFLAAVSRLWMWLAERPPFGFPFIVAFHAGADVAVVLVFTALDFGWATKRAAFAAALTASLVLAAFGAVLLVFAWRHEPEFSCLARQRRDHDDPAPSHASRRPCCSYDDDDDTPWSHHDPARPPRHE